MGADNRDLRWLWDDATCLFGQNRKNAALLLLLCAVDALAKREYPSEDKVRVRYTTFLNDGLKKHIPTADMVWHRTPAGQGLRFADVVYKYLRNPVVHQGQDLSDADEICVRWSCGTMFWDLANKPILLGGDDCLEKIVGDATFGAPRVLDVRVEFSDEVRDMLHPPNT